MKKEDFNEIRRNFLKLSGGALISIGLPGVFATLTSSEIRDVQSELRPDGRQRIPPGQVAVKTLRKMGGEPGPGLHPGWKLVVSSAGDRPLSFSWQELMALPQIELICDIHCVTGWTLLDSVWQGIRLKSLIKDVNVRQDGFIIFQAHGEYTSNIPMEEAVKDNVILAHSFSGQVLSQSHGAPLRALVPDRYFYKSAKWLNGIKFSTLDEPGYWEKLGFSNSADPWKEERF